MNIHVLVFTHPNHLTDVTKIDLDLLSASAVKLGHSIKIIFARDCQLVLGDKPQVLINNKKEKIDVLLVRPNFLSTNLEFRCALIKQFELAGVKVINRGFAVLRAKDKFRTMQILNKYGVPVPKTYVVANADFIDDVIKDIGSFPCIIKAVVGSHGSGVAIVESKRGLRSVIDMFTSGANGGPIIIQEYIKEAKGKDIRVFVVGKKIVGAMERIAAKKRRI